MPYEGFSFLTRGEDGIWRRRTTNRSPSRGDATEYSVSTYPNGPISQHGGPRQPVPPSGPRPPSRDKMGSSSRPLGIYQLHRSSRQSSAPGTGVSAVVYGRHGSGRSPGAYGIKTHSSTLGGTGGQTDSPSEYIKARLAVQDPRPSTASGVSAYKGAGYSSSAVGLSIRGGYNFRSGRYVPSVASPGSSNAVAPSSPKPHPPASPSGSPSRYQASLYRRNACSSPGAPDRAQEAPRASSPTRVQIDSGAAWADATPSEAQHGGSHGPRHTSLTPAKVVADLHRAIQVEAPAAALAAGAEPAQTPPSPTSQSHGRWQTREPNSSHPPAARPKSPDCVLQPSSPLSPHAPPPLAASTSPYGRSHVSSSPAAATGRTPSPGQPYGRQGYASGDGCVAKQQEPQRPASSTKPLSTSSDSGATASQNSLPAGVDLDPPDDGKIGMIPGYSVSKLVGEGGFCQVRLGIHHLSNRKVAIKMIEKAKLTDSNDRKRVAREIKVLKRANNANIIKLFEVIDSPAHIYIVMEFAASGSVLDYVRARKRLSEKEACWFFKQIIHALEFCHSVQVVHRDVKLENILLDHENHLKLIDFGLSTFIQAGKMLRVHCGSPSYAAPEIVGRKLYHGPPVDIWSTGVVLFAMMAGYLPFHAGSNKQELCQKIMRGVYKEPESMSMDARDLLRRMLTTDPEARITIPEIWEHPWVKNGPAYERRADGGLYNIGRDLATGAVHVDDGILKEMEAHGFDPRKTLECLMRNDCNYITATYFLLAEGRAANGSLSLSRKSSSSGVQLNKAVSTSPVGKWDDSAIAVHRRHDAALNRVVA